MHAHTCTSTFSLIRTFLSVSSLSLSPALSLSASLTHILVHAYTSCVCVQPYLCNLVDKLKNGDGNEELEQAAKEQWWWSRTEAARGAHKGKGETELVSWNGVSRTSRWEV